jgi:hypothetical protein
MNKKTIIQILVAVCILIAFFTYKVYSNTTKFEVTFDPVKDAKTCAKIYERNKQYGQECIDKTLYLYYRNDDADINKFMDIVTTEIARLSVE